MRCAKKRKLEAVGFKVGTVGEFMGLSAEGMALIDMKVGFVTMLKAA